MASHQVKLPLLLGTARRQHSGPDWPTYAQDRRPWLKSGKVFVRKAAARWKPHPIRCRRFRLSHQLFSSFGIF